MKTLKIVYGTEEVRKIENGESLSVEEEKLNYKEYRFETEKEAKAFLFGIEEVIGWNQYLVIEK